MGYMLTDDLWAALEPLVRQAERHKGGKPPVLSERNFFEALLYLARTGIPWRDLLSELGRSGPVYNRFRRWVACGALRRLSEALTAEAVFAGVQRVLIDSTIVRAHQHAAAARRKK